MPTWLAPKPFRGDQVAAGAVTLVLLVALLQWRFAGDWPDGVHLGYAAAAAALVLGMAIAAPPAADGGPPAWHSTLYVTGFLLSAVTLVDVARVLDAGSAGTVTWIAALLTALGTWMSRGRGSASGTLLAALAGVVTTVAFVAWVVDPGGPSTYRWLLLADAIALATMALWERIRRPVHGVQLLNAAGLALLGIAAIFGLEAVGSFLGAVFSGPGSILGAASGGEGRGHHGIAWGWATVMLGGGVGILSAGAADNERGNVLVGSVVLAAFTAMAAGGNLIGWPLILAGFAAALIGVGLRPTTPLPDEPPVSPGAGAADAPLPFPRLRARQAPPDES